MKLTKYHIGIAISFGFKDFSWLDLSGANLRGANLSDADIKWCVGEMRFIKSIQISEYMICYTSTHLSIGCQMHKVEDWNGFSDERIIDMDGEKALKFWRKFKDFIFMAIELSPAESGQEG